MSVIGIDLGNLSSKIAVARQGGVDIIVNETSNRTTPSLVSYGHTNRAIGESAKTMETSNFKNTIGSLKRVVGRTFADQEVQDVERKYFNAEMVDTGKEVGFKVRYLGEETTLSATQILGAYFGHLRDIAKRELKTVPVQDVAIAVPGWYTSVQRQAVIDAAHIAGLNCLRLVNDLTAAAILWGIPKFDLPAAEEPPKHVCIIDIGHSNYSVGIAAFNTGSVVMKGTAYDRHFGGRDFDNALLHHFAAEFKDKYKIDVLSNAKATFRLAAGCEKLKKVLSANAYAPLKVESIMNDIDASSSLKREDYEQMIQPLLARINVPIEQALKDAGLDVSQIDYVEVIGGCTRTPAIKTALSAFFGDKTLSYTLNQDEGVVRGTTFACAMLSPNLRVRPYHITDINTYPIQMSWDPVPEEKEDTCEHVVFPKGCKTNNSRSITFKRSNPFTIKTAYSSDANIPTGINPWLSQFTVKDVKADENGVPMIVKARAKINIHGVVSFTSAEALKEVVEDVAMEGTPAEDAEGAAEATPAAAQKTRKLVKVADLPIVGGGLGADTDSLAKWFEIEGQQHAADRLVKETEEQKNALEEYVYDQRSKIDEKYAAFITADEKAPYKEALNAAEAWLYSEEGEDAKKSQYVAKSEELKAMGEPIKFRYDEHHNRGKAATQLREVIEKYMSNAQKGEEKYSHITAEENQKVLEAVVTAQQWLSDMTARQAEKPKNVKPLLTSELILKRRSEIISLAEPIYSRPKPKVEAPPAPEAKESAKTETPEPAAATEAPEMDID